MSEFHATLYGDDAERAREFQDRLEEELPGGVDSNAATLRAAFDLADDALDD